MKYLLLWSGEEGIEVSSTWDLSDIESNTLSVYWDRFGKYVAPKSNFIIARFKLRSMKQDNGESVDAYMKTVRILARECKYTDTKEHMLDTLVFGTNSERVQSKLIQRDETLSLDEAIDIARTEEATKQQLQSLRAESNIQAMSNRRRQATRKPWHNAANYGTKHDGRSTQNQCTLVSHNSVPVITVVIVVDNVECCTQMSSKTVPLLDLLVADVATLTTG